MMNHYTKIIRYTIFSLLLGVGLIINGAPAGASAQDQEAAQKKEASDKSRSGERDPFARYRPLSKPKKNVAVPLTPPTIQERIERYKAQKMAAMTAQLPAPKPTTALLLNEMQVVGIFRTPRGYAAMIEATPIKLSYVIYPGETFYDGQLVAIEEDRLVFRHETRWTDGRRERAVETKPLRQSNAVADSLTSTRGTTTNVPAVDSPKKEEEKTSVPEKQ
ncbi:MAG: hypothetical protein ICV60_24060 [Pyrinomonadaceae bacterium]|nr:hypothetical protein [Pyrinomonadaceae bacterium]